MSSEISFCSSSAFGAKQGHAAYGSTGGVQETTSSFGFESTIKSNTNHSAGYTIHTVVALVHAALKPIEVSALTLNSYSENALWHRDIF